MKSGNETSHISFEELLDKRHGKIGTATRDEFEMKSKSFIIGEMIKEERRLAKLTALLSLKTKQ